MPYSLPNKPEANPNAELIGGLEELTAFLREHPELPPFYGSVSRSVYGKDAREQMTLFARALGSRAVERTDPILGEKVELMARFGTVSLSMTATVRDLGGASVPAHLSYAPILTGSES